MWDHCKTKLGKESDGGHEEFVRFGNLELNDEAIHATDAQSLTCQLGYYVFDDLTSQELRLRAQVSSCEMVEWTASCGTHSYDGEPPLPLLWTGRHWVWQRP